MAEIISQEMALLIEELRREVSRLTQRVAQMESPAGAPVAAEAAPPAAKSEEAPGITEEELLAISGALAAYLGVRPHIRQIRLVSSHAWAAQGRATIQASHRLHS